MDPLKERISVLEMGEARGKLRPEHAAELARYRQSGATKSAAPPPRQAAAPSVADTAISLDAPATTPKGQTAQAASTKVSGMRTFRKQLHQVRQLYDRDMSKAGAAGLNEYNPFRRQNQEFDGEAATLAPLARQAFRVSGSGGDSNSELKVILDTLPNRWSFDGTNQGRFRALDNIIGDVIANNAGLAGYSREQAAALRAEAPYRPSGKRALPKPPPSVRKAPTGRAVYDINGNPVR